MAKSGGAGTHPPGHPGQSWGQPQAYSSCSLCLGGKPGQTESAGRLSDHMGRQPEPGRGPGVLPGQRDKAGSMVHVSAPPQGAQPHPGACMELAVLKLQALPSPSFRAGAGRRPSTWRPEEKEVALSPGSVAGEK